MASKTVTGASGRRYTILREIGRGGFGEVHLVRDSDGINYAMKTIRGVDDPLVAASFEQELTSAFGLNHPNVVQVHDHGVFAPKGQPPALYAILEFCEGGDYRRQLGRYGAEWPGFDRIRMDILQVLDGLEALHTRILHRDLKPENILESKEHLKISDFGMAKFVDQATRTLTFKGGGTPRYMAPEAWELRQTSRATDLYAVGVMLFEALTGRPPFEAGDINALRDQHLYTAAPRPSAANPNVPTYVDGVVKRLLEKEPVRRYQSVPEVREALSRAERTVLPEVTEIVAAVRKGHDAAEQARLEAERQKRAAEEEGRRIQHMENEILALFDEAVGEINGVLEETQIDKGPWRARAVYRFGNRELHVEFFRRGELYADPLVPGRMDTLHQQHAVHGGVVEIREAGQDRQGWNVVLVRPPDSIYGEWRLVETRVSAFVPRRMPYEPFATQAQLFADNLSCHWHHAMHTYNLTDKALDRDDILKVLRIFVGAQQ